MRIVIEADAKEIAAILLAVEKRHDAKVEFDKLIQKLAKGLNDVMIAVPHKP